MKIILWIGNEPNQKALAHKIHQAFPLSAIVLESRKKKRTWTLALVFEKVIEKIFLSSIAKAWWNMLRNYNQKFPHYPQTEILDVENINSDAAAQFTAQHQPDLILVSGTRLIKEKMFEIQPSIGILNLHTGLSPYVKGGPNCSNWCIANQEFHLIGNTIMWIDKGIDTGHILTTETTPLTGDESFQELHLKVMNHAHDLYLNAIKFLHAGKHQSIPQSNIAAGKTYYTKEWTLAQKFKLLRNFKKLKKQYQNGTVQSKQKSVQTIALRSN